MDIDVIGAAISQSTIQQSLDFCAVANVAEIVEALVIGVVGTHRNQPIPYDLGNDVRLLKTLAGLGVKENRAWCPIDTMRPSEMIGTEQHGRADLGLCKAVSARRGVIRDRAVQRITGVVTASLPETDGPPSIHRDAAKTNHRTAFEMSYKGPSMISRLGVFLPACCFVIQVT
jgi:hypothetical protein